jgi:hypothetical protein
MFRQPVYTLFGQRAAKTFLRQASPEDNAGCAIPTLTSGQNRFENLAWKAAIAFRSGSTPEPHSFEWHFPEED